MTLTSTARPHPARRRPVWQARPSAPPTGGGVALTGHQVEALHSSGSSPCGRTTGAPTLTALRRRSRGASAGLGTTCAGRRAAAGPRPRTTTSSRRPPPPRRCLPKLCQPSCTHLRTKGPQNNYPRCFGTPRFSPLRSGAGRSGGAARRGRVQPWAVKPLSRTFAYFRHSPNHSEIYRVVHA